MVYGTEDVGGVGIMDINIALKQRLLIRILQTEEDSRSNQTGEGDPMCPECMSLQISILFPGKRNNLHRCGKCDAMFILTKKGKLGRVYPKFKKQTEGAFLYLIRNNKRMKAYAIIKK